MADSSTAPSTLRLPAQVWVVLVSLVAAVALLASGADGSVSQGSATSLVANAPGATTPTTLIAPGRPGRVAYVTPAGELIVAEGDGSSPRTVGRDAASNSAGLSPMAWSPATSQLAYVRTDGALVLANANGEGDPQIIATDAIVPPEADENLLSFDITGISVAYIAKGPGDIAQAKLAVFDGADKGKFVSLSDPANRVPLEIQFSPLDPYLYLRSADVETRKEFTIAVVEPFSGTPFATNFSVDDPSFAPDGAFLFGVLASKGKDQLAKVDAANGRLAVLVEQDRICKPKASPDGRQIAYAAGANCQEIWVVNNDGSDPRRVADTVGGSASFAGGTFSWSLDSRTLTHAACRSLEQGVSCGGNYWDIAVDGSTITARAAAGSVLREQRPQLKAIKVKIEMSGPVAYDGRMLVSSKESTYGLLQKPRDVAVDVKAGDQRDDKRIFSVKLQLAKDSRFVTGTIRIQDPDGTDQTVTIFGSVLLQSYRFATVRAIWLKTTSMPMQSGRLDLIVYR